MNFGNDLTQGSVFKKYIFFIVPIFLSGFMQQLYNTADVLVVGKFVGDSALAAVGSTGSITHLILNLFLGLAIGTNVVCARFYGAKNTEGLQRAIHTSVFLAIISGIVLAVVGVAFSRDLLSLMGSPDDVIDEATLYMQIFFLGSPASMLYNFGAAVLRAAGDTKRPLYIMLLSGLVNVALNLFCVLVLEIGVVGVAIGTVASQIVSAIIVLYLLAKTNNEFKLCFSKLAIHKRELIQIAAIGIPSGLNGIMFSLSNVTVQSTINSFGKAAMAGASAANNIENYAFLLLASVGEGAVTFVGQNLGAKKYDRIKSCAKIALATGIVLTLAFSGLAVLLGETLLGFFADEASKESIVKMGMLKLMITTYSYVVFVPSQALSGVLKGLGKAVEVTVINAVCTCVVRILWVLFVFPFNPTLQMLYLCYPISWGLASVATMISYLKARNHMDEPVFK